MNSKLSFYQKKGDIDYVIHIPKLIKSTNLKNVIHSLQYTKIEDKDIYVDKRFTSKLNPVKYSYLYFLFDSDYIKNTIFKYISQPYNLTKNTLRLSRDIPIEYRVYKPESVMGLHRDILLSNPPQLEVVLMLHNTSDAKFVFRNHKNKLNIISPEIGDVIIVRGFGTLHGVSRCHKGERYILKLCYYVK